MFGGLLVCWGGSDFRIGFSATCTSGTPARLNGVYVNVGSWGGLNLSLAIHFFLFVLGNGWRAKSQCRRGVRQINRITPDSGGGGRRTRDVYAYAGGDEIL